MISRRWILTTAGASVLILGAGATTWSLTRTPRLATEPWRAAAEGFGETRLNALAYAILAPSPHNMQPWRVRLEGEDARSILCDTARQLPETDPLARQVTIGFGCFLEVLSQAAAEQGQMAEITPFPEGEPTPLLDERPVAHVRFVPDTNLQRDPLFGEILNRRTNRSPFEADETPSREDLDAILTATRPGVTAEATTNADRVQSLRDMTRRAWTREWETPHVRRETIAVTRIGKAEINADPDGIALAGPMLEAMNIAGVLTRENMDDPTHSAFSQSHDIYAKACETATGHVWSITSNNTRFDQLEAGRAWVRMQLAANQRGVSFHPLSQALQEFPEMAEFYAEAHDELAPNGGTVQMLARIGYAKHPTPSVRWSVRSKLEAV